MRPRGRARPIGAIVVAAVAAGLFFWVAAGYGEAPECGTGTSFMASLGPWLGLLLYGPLVTAVAATAVVVLLGRWVGCSVVVALVMLETAAAALGASWSYAAYDCARYTPHDHMAEAAWTVAITSGIAACLVMGVAALVGWVAGPRRPADWSAPEGMRRVGLYQVRSVAAGATSGRLRAGVKAWVAVDAERILLQPVAPKDGPAPAATELALDGLQVDQLGWTTSLWGDGRLLLELDPAGVGTQDELVVALTEEPA